MIMIILMVLDIISFVILSLVNFNQHPPIQFVLMAAAYLISKPFIFKDVMSWVDFFIGVYLIISLIFISSTLLYWLIFGWFLYKLVFTVIFLTSN